MLFGAGGVLAALLFGSPSVSGGDAGAALGILGYFLGSRAPSTATVSLGVAAIILALAAIQGFIPGIESLDRWLAG